MMDFNVGDSVICIDDKSNKNIPYLDMIFNTTKGIRENSKYIVSEAYIDNENKLSLLLSNTFNGSTYGFPHYYGYAATRFKKIDDGLVEITFVFEKIKEKT